MTSVELGEAPVNRGGTPLRGGKRYGSPAAKRAVTADQRARIFAAVVELVASNGYAATTLNDIARAAGTSKSVIGEKVGTKEQCFVWVLDRIVEQAIGNANQAYLQASEWEEKLTSGFGVFLDEVLNQEDAARVALVEAFAGGQAAFDRMELAAREFEEMLRSTFAASPRRVVLPAVIAKGVVGGVSRVVRQHLLDNRVSQLPEHGDELVDWMRAFCSPAAAGLQFRRRPDPTPPRARRTVEDPRHRMTVTAAQLADKHSYKQLRPGLIALTAGLPHEAFAETFAGGVEECFLEAYSVLGAEVLTGAATAAGAAPGDWPQRVCAGLDSILWRISRDTVFASVAFVEVYSAGHAGIAGRTNLMQAFSDLLTAEVPASCAPTTVAAEAIVGAVWQLAHQAVWRKATRQLPALSDTAAYLVLTPLIGGERALQEIKARP